MSQQRAHTIRRIEELGLVMAIAFATPLIVSFVLWLVATTIGAPLAVNGTPLVGYGISGLNSTSGVSYLWVPKTGTGPSFPTGLLNLINAIIDFISILVGVITGIRLAPSLIELGGEGQ